MDAVIEEGSAVGIWKRVIEPESGTLLAPEAHALLRLKFTPADLDRADALAGKARTGRLTAQEERQLDNYLTIASTLEFLKAKARRSLESPAAD